LPDLTDCDGLFDFPFLIEVFPFLAAFGIEKDLEVIFFAQAKKRRVIVVYDRRGRARTCEIPYRLRH
jgi:hypothetical protein